jgi:hypothetical protein
MRGFKPQIRKSYDQVSLMLAGSTQLAKNFPFDDVNVLIFPDFYHIRGSE